MALNDDIAVVTGASRGIGQAIALELGARGATVIGTATTDGGAEAISASLAEHNVRGTGKVLNVTDADSIAAFSAAMSRLSGLIPSAFSANAPSQPLVPSGCSSSGEGIVCHRQTRSPVSLL